MSLCSVLCEGTAGSIQTLDRRGEFDWGEIWRDKQNDDDFFWSSPVSVSLSLNLFLSPYLVDSIPLNRILFVHCIDLVLGYIHE